MPIYTICALAAPERIVETFSCRDDLAALERADGLLAGSSGLEIWQGERWVGGFDAAGDALSLAPAARPRQVPFLSGPRPREP